MADIKSNAALDILNNQQAINDLVVAANRGNNLAFEEGPNTDLLDMSYAGLLLKYGKEVADNRVKLNNTFSDYGEVINTSRSVDDLVNDSALDISSGIVGTVGGLAGATLGLTGFDNASLKIGELSDKATSYLQSQQSSELKNRRPIQEIESRLDNNDNQAQYETEIARGDNKLVADFKHFGREFLNTGDRIFNDSAVTGSLISQAIGSLGPSAKIASVASQLAIKGASKLTANQALINASSKAGIASSVGVTEASGVYTETVNAVMQYSHEDLIRTSSEYAQLVTQGMSRQDAKTKLATDAGVDAFTRQLPVATALGLIASKFEAAPIRSFSGSDLIDNFRQIGIQTLEESGQGVSGAFNKNSILQQDIDPNIKLTDKLGENAATNAIAGFGMSTVLATPSLVKNSASELLKQTVKIPGTETVKKTGKVVADGLDKTAKAVTKVKEVTAPVVEPIVKAVKPVVKKAAEVAVEAAKPVTDKIEEVANRPTEKARNESIQASRNVTEKISTFVEKRPDDKVLSESVSEIGVDIDNAPVPEVFNDNDKVSSTNTVIQNLAGMLETLSDKKIDTEKLSDIEAAYVVDRFEVLKDNVDKAPSSLKVDINQILNSPDYKKVQANFDKIDLNDNQDKNTKITKDIINLNISVATKNPAAVNPDVVKKIVLNHSNDGTVSKEQLKILRAAGKIALAVNNHVGEQVRISEEKGEAILQKDESSTPEILTPETVSRSVQVGGYTDKRGYKLRSVTDFASHIITAMQTKDKKYINKDSVSEPVEGIAQEFNNLIQHMSNKIEALNKSFDAQKENGGKAPEIHFDSLVGGKTFLKAGHKSGSAPVFYAVASPASIANAQIIHNDATVALSVYNTLSKAFPDLKLPEMVIPNLRKVSDSNKTKSKEQKVKQEVPDTTVVEEEVLPQAQTFDEQDKQVPDFSHLPEVFSKTYTIKDDELEFTNAKELMDLIKSKENYSKEFVMFANELFNPIIKGLNARLKFARDTQSKNSKDISTFRRFKNLNITDSKFKKYDDRLIGLATLAMIDWLSSARSTNEQQVKNTLEDFGVDYSDLTDTEFDTMMHGILPEVAVQQVSKAVLRLWNVKGNIDTPMADMTGIVEGVVKETFTVLNQFSDPDKGTLLNIRTVKINTGGNTIISAKGKKVQKAMSLYNIRGLKDVQEILSLHGQDTIQKLLAPEDNKLPSVNEKIKYVDQTQSRGDIPLTSDERRVLKRIQDTAHKLVPNSAAIVKDLIGFEALQDLLGFTNMDTFRGNHTLKLSVEGKNLGIVNDLDDAYKVIDAINNASDDPTSVDVHYPVGITKVGRHQFKGINPQGNKILRMLVTPTHSTLDMTKEEDIKVFWLTVSQASGLNKVENEDHKVILSDIETRFNNQFSEAIAVVSDWLETGKVSKTDRATLVEALDNDFEMSHLGAVIAVAEFYHAKVKGTELEFKTSLSFELDGKTDGPGNMMMNFGQKDLSPEDEINFKRVGFFIGKVTETLNNFFYDGSKRKNHDLYEETAIRGDTYLNAKIAQTDGRERDVLIAARHFAAFFGDLKIEGEGKDKAYKMTRKTAKNPMTKIVYGSTFNGVGRGMAQDMLVEFYDQISKLDPETDVVQHFISQGYTNIQKDLTILFGEALSEDLTSANLHKFEFQKESVEDFYTNISNSLGKVLYNTARDVIGSPVGEVNDLLIFITNIQTKFLSKVFKIKLQELANKRTKNGNISELSKRDYDTLTAEMNVYSPMYFNGTQTLNVGALSNKASDIALSSNMTEELNQKSFMFLPDEAGVRSIAYVSQGRGDGMMMNTLFMGDTPLEGVIPIFDGVDMSINKIKEYSQLVNKGVKENWNRDILQDVVDDFQSFLRHAGNDSDLLLEAFQEVKSDKKTKNTSVKSKDTDELLISLVDMQKGNKARKDVFQEISSTTHHMGGDDSGYVIDGEELSLNEINNKIVDKLETEPPEVIAANSKPYTNEEVASPSVKHLIKSLSKLSSETKKTLTAVKDLLPDNLKIFTGTPEALNKKYQEDFSKTNGVVVSKSGTYDPEFNAVFLTQDGNETLIHELVHVAILQKVLTYYEEAITNSEPENHNTIMRLEKLMTEFMELDFSKSDAHTQEQVRFAIREINSHLTSNSPTSKAYALNEFMAWTLANEHIAKTLKTTRTSVAAKITRTVMNLMRRLLGGVPQDIFSNILFNAKLLNYSENIPTNNSNLDIGNGGDNGGDGNNNNNNNEGGELTPEANSFTNYWINIVKQRIAQQRTNPTTDKRKLVDYIYTSRDVVSQLEQGGFSLNEEQKQTFKAIHAVLATEMRLNTASMIAMNDLFDHIVSNLKPEMFGPDNAEQRYSTVMNLFGSTKNDEGVSDSIAVLLALSQTSKGFRKALDELPKPPKQDSSVKSLNDALTTVSTFMMRHAVEAVDITDKKSKDLLDDLSENLLRQDSEKEYALLASLMNNVNKADKFLSGKFSEIADKTSAISVEVDQSNRSNLTKALVKTAAVGVSLADEKSTNQLADLVKRSLWMGVDLKSFMPIQEFVTEVIGADEYNSTLISLRDKVSYALSSVRQIVREDLPGVFQRKFSKSPNAEQWKTLHKVLGKADFASIYNISNSRASMRLLSQPNHLNTKIQQAESTIGSVFDRPTTALIKEKSQQLADYMNGKGAGYQLWTNAHAINTHAGSFQANMTKEIDKLASLYALKEIDGEQKQAVLEIYREDPKAIDSLMAYIQALNREEEAKITSTSAKLNGYKGYIPDIGEDGSRLVIEKDSEKDRLESLGYTRVADYKGQDDVSISTYGVYHTTTKQGGAYSQGILQLVQDSYKGVDSTTGLTVNGSVSGIISGVAADSITTHMNTINDIADPKEALIPRYDDEGNILHYEKSINPDLMEQYNKPRSNLALMISAWAGRQVEEKLAGEYNRTLVDEIKRVYDTRKAGTDDLYINIKAEVAKLNAWKRASREQRKRLPKGDEIFAENWKVIPTQTKEYIESIFEKGEFWVRKDQTILNLGYREASIADVWSGKTRLPEAVQTTVKAVANLLPGNKAMTALSHAEEGTQSIISSAKDLIVVRSLIVPAMNVQANVLQLANRGVGSKDMVRGTKEKLAEIEEFNKNTLRIIELEADIFVQTDENKKAILEQRVQVIRDQNLRMSIDPIIKAGQYKNISEGITDLDVSLRNSRLGELFEQQLDRLPGGVQGIVKYGFLSKDTKIYQLSNKAVQYGDFISKSIYHDHLVKHEGLTSEQALAKVNKEFVNFSLLPGRTRSFIESMGGSWFFAFKIRIMKVALSMMQNNPARSLITAATVGDMVGSPVNDNLISTELKGTLDYSIGWDMLWGSPGINPWLNVSDWATD